MHDETNSSSSLSVSSWEESELDEDEDVNDSFVWKEELRFSSNLVRTTHVLDTEVLDVPFAGSVGSVLLESLS